MPSHSLNYKKYTSGSTWDVAEEASTSFSLLLIVPASKTGSGFRQLEELLRTALKVGASSQQHLRSAEAVKSS